MQSGSWETRPGAEPGDRVRKPIWKCHRVRAQEIWETF
jgi:hypothetical protein